MGVEYPTNVRFWLQADILMARYNVRFTPNRRHSLADVRYRADYGRGAG